MTNVTVTYCHPGNVEHEFMFSFMRMREYDRHHNGFMNGWLPVESNAGGLTDSRNVAVAEYLERFPEDDWLFIVDADMGFAPHTLEMLMQSADPEQRPIVGGLCFAQAIVSHGSDELGTPAEGFVYAPTIYMMNGEIPTAIAQYPNDALVECAATGAACLLVHRSVFEKMAEEFEGPHHWFHRPIITATDADGKTVRKEFGEDITFCLRARKLGFPIYVDTAVKTSHKKHHYLTEKTVGHLLKDRATPPNRQQRRRRRRK